MSVLRKFAAAFCLSVLFSVSANATTVRQLDVTTLIKNTGAVVYVRTNNVDPTCSGRKTPCTIVELEVLRQLAGARLDEKVILTLPGGELVDGTFVRIIGAPIFQPETRYLLFLRAGPWRLTPVTNWHHSFFRAYALGKDEESLFFVDDDGHAITGITEKEITTGPQIAPPDDLAIRFSGGGMSGRSGIVRNDRAKPDADVREQLQRRDGSAKQADSGKLGLPAPALFERIRELVSRVNPAMAEADIQLEPATLKPGEQLQYKPSEKEAETYEDLEALREEWLKESQSERFSKPGRSSPGMED